MKISTYNPQSTRSLLASRERTAQLIRTHASRSGGGETVGVLLQENETTAHGLRLDLDEAVALRDELTKRIEYLREPKKAGTVCFAND